MSFRFSDSFIDEYHTRGYTVFRSILPPSLLSDLRQSVGQVHEIARKKSGPQAQRLQPIADFDVDLRPFHDYAELPELKDAIARVLTPLHMHGNLLGGGPALGILIEPAELPYCTSWHRDWRDNMSGLKLSDWDAVFHDINYFNQVNCAIYEDSCTWIVPGSHLRRDLLLEAERFPDRPIRGPDLNEKNYEERERLCLEYCESMPGALQLHLNAGDFALYRNTLWHLGSYVTYRKRATIHEVVDTQQYVDWRARIAKEADDRRRQGLLWENPNAKEH